ncbi:MAG: omptin family outer membrane protease [Candidatus Omnitrophica bacterium]|nr:omptin family outer membrane protease [Candidatus Omnitrophota bacterium]
MRRVLFCVLLMSAMPCVAEAGNVYIYDESSFVNEPSSIIIYGSDERYGKEQDETRFLEDLEKSKHFERETPLPPALWQPRDVEHGQITGGGLPAEVIKKNLDTADSPAIIPRETAGYADAPALIADDAFEEETKDIIENKDNRKSCDGIKDPLDKAVEKEIRRFALRKFFNEMKKQSDEATEETGFFSRAGLDVGYLSGNTTYDFNNGVSELSFPMSNWMLGSNLSAGFNNFSINGSVWATLLDDYAGDDMSDKDWCGGCLWFYTESDAHMDAVIWDVNFRYDFYHEKNGNRKGKAAFLIGYTSQRFNYDLFGIKDVLYGQDYSEYDGVEVIEYEIEYRLPYIGLAGEFSKNKWDISLDLCFSPYATADDIDQHLLRDLTFYGNYDSGYAWIARLNGRYHLKPEWYLDMGVSATVINIEGHTWEESRDPVWDADQNTTSLQILGRVGVTYEF